MADYEGTPKVLLEKAGAGIGDVIAVSLPDGRSFQGTLMPHHAASANHILTIKLSSGYNVGVHVDGSATVRRVTAAPPRSATARTFPAAAGKPRVVILGTGGTIASYVDYRTGAVHPATTPEELAFAAPEIFEVADVKTRVVFQMFSEDLQPEHWQAMAREVKKEFDAGARGVVIPHGTDTLSYTSAALAFFLRDLPGPVVLVGSQRSSDRPSSDAAINLKAAVDVAATSDLGEVVAVMHAATDDGACAIHRGTRVRKMHTSRRDAFQSINALPLGFVEKGQVRMTQPYRKAGKGPVVLDEKIDEEVSMIQSYPGLWPDHLEKVVLRGVVIVGTGLGHIARRNLDMVRTISTGKHPDGSPRLRYDGKVAGPSYVVMGSQCLHGRTNMNVYSTGRDLLDAGCIEAHDMLPETAYIKLMWVLGHTQDPAEVHRLMRTNLVGEMDERSPVDEYATGHRLPAPQ
ncbi:MAG TPA: Glu-tRNA(Gln) amidotransferase subunit GatD [Candidatus Thermoplasmatota archaeon]|nr:Glu-tRNA(Gln) amidotransferase subunit GatD [Candidatus Thermoplasmatota archaeon]